MVKRNGIIRINVRRNSITSIVNIKIQIVEIRIVYERRVKQIVTPHKKIAALLVDILPVCVKPS